MANLAQKFGSFFSALREGEFIALFNDLMKKLRLNRLVGIGRSYFFSIDSYCHRFNDVDDEPTDDSFRLTSENDPAIIRDLLDCMVDSHDYAYLSETEIVERFEHLIAEGNSVQVARIDKRIVGFFWTTSRDYSMACGLRKLVLQLPEHVAFIEFIFVHPDFRRQGLYGRMFRKFAKVDSDTVFCCLVDYYNKASIGAQLKAGFHESGRLTYYQFFGFHPIRFCLENTRKTILCPKKDIAYRIQIDYRANR